LTLVKAGQDCLRTLVDDADLLILGAYGQDHLSEMLMGGVTDHGLKYADLPLLLVR